MILEHTIDFTRTAYTAYSTHHMVAIATAATVVTELIRLEPCRRSQLGMLSLGRFERAAEAAVAAVAARALAFARCFEEPMVLITKSFAPAFHFVMVVTLDSSPSIVGGTEPSVTVMVDLGPASYSRLVPDLMDSIKRMPKARKLTSLVPCVQKSVASVKAIRRSIA